MVGDPVRNWRPARRDFRQLQGRYAALEPMSVALAEDIHAANAEDTAGRIWDFLPYGPFDTAKAYAAWVAEITADGDPYFYAIRDLERGHWGGIASYLRINPRAGSIEVGHINLAPRLQRTRAATEAMLLMMRQAFAMGYRRYEWKCNALNRGSRAAAQRLGMSFEGVHRQAAVVKGCNRDTAWFSVLDREWPAVEAAFETWLAPENFDAEGRQRQALRDLTRPLSGGGRPDARIVSVFASIRAVLGN